jgi:hypothetical protein
MLLVDIFIWIAQIIIILMPFVSIVATGWLFYLWRKSGNRILRMATITGGMITVGGGWWAFIALRRILGFVPFPDWVLIFYAISLLLILSTPLIKLIELIRISRVAPTEAEIDRMIALGYSLKQSSLAETQNQREDREFGEVRRELEVKHNLDNPE